MKPSVLPTTKKQVFHVENNISSQREKTDSIFSIYGAQNLHLISTILAQKYFLSIFPISISTLETDM
jgi:hypothetical protein